MPYIVGLNSGSSFDGIDAPKYIDALTMDWPESLRQPIQKAFHNELTLFEVTRINYAAGALFAEAVNTLLAKTNLQAEDIDVIGYDGQTIYQEPPDHTAMSAFSKTASNSLADMWLHGGYPCGSFIVESGAVAGSGAPLMQYLDFVSFRHEKDPVLTLNIGGIANLQLVCGTDRSKMMAFDTGSGNVMIDHVVKARTGVLYDKDGELARRGTLLPDLLERLLKHNFFSRKPPRSAWRLDFGAQFADGILREYQDASTEDLLATLTAFTAISVERAVVDFILPKANVKTLIASGGGVKNLFLLQTLKERLEEHGMTVIVADDVGLPATYKEAIKFATLAFATKRGLANNIPAASGAKGFACLGKMTLAPRLAKGCDEMNE